MREPYLPLAQVKVCPAEWQTVRPASTVDALSSSNTTSTLPMSLHYDATMRVWQSPSLWALHRVGLLAPLLGLRTLWPHGPNASRRANPNLFRPGVYDEGRGSEEGDEEDLGWLSRGGALDDDRISPDGGTIGGPLLRWRLRQIVQRMDGGLHHSSGSESGGLYRDGQLPATTPLQTRPMTARAAGGWSKPPTTMPVVREETMAATTLGSALARPLAAGRRLTRSSSAGDSGAVGPSHVAQWPWEKRNLSIVITPSVLRQRRWRMHHADPAEFRRACSSEYPFGDKNWSDCETWCRPAVKLAHCRYCHPTRNRMLALHANTTMPLPLFWHLSLPPSSIKRVAHQACVTSSHPSRPARVHLLHTCPNAHRQMPGVSWVP